jgi:hypothetical protein
MEFQSNWRYDNFYPDAQAMRQKIDDHFTEAVAGKQPFNQRAVWNYWFIPTLYTYFRAEPWSVFTQPVYDAFMQHLRAFAARQYGLAIPTMPFISMYVNGCGQNIHNDFGNGRLAYVFSLTNWEQRHFLGGETFIYSTGDTVYEKYFQSTGGWGFYDFIEPVFNRLAMFDDRFPHAVNFIQGTMDPHDARFVLHGHMEESDTPYVEGGLRGVDISALFLPLKSAVRDMLLSHGMDGFISLALPVGASGISGPPQLRCMQLLPKSREAKGVSLAVDDAKALVAKVIWPQTANPSTLVLSLGATPLR